MLNPCGHSDSVDRMKSTPGGDSLLCQNPRRKQSKKGTEIRFFAPTYIATNKPNLHRDDQPTSVDGRGSTPGGDSLLCQTRHRKLKNNQGRNIGESEC